MADIQPAEVAHFVSGMQNSFTIVENNNLSSPLLTPVLLEQLAQWLNDNGVLPMPNATQQAQGIPNYYYLKTILSGEVDIAQVSPVTFTPRP